MNQEEIRKFLMKETFTGKLGTINKDGSSHITPIWYILDENNYITFTTYFKSVKTKNLLRDSRICICVDDQASPFSFVIVYGVAKVNSQSADTLVWTTKIAERYMGMESSLEWKRMLLKENCL